MLKCRVEQVEPVVRFACAAHSEVQFDVVDRRRCPSVTFDVGEFSVADGQPIIDPGIELGELINAIEDVADKFFQKQSWGDADVAAQVAGDRSGEHFDVGVVDDGSDAIGFVGTLGIEIPDPAADFAQRCDVETGQSELDGPRVVESGVGREVGMEALGQWWESSRSLWAVEESRGAGDQQVQPGESALVDFVDQLAKSIERPVTNVGADPLQCLHLVEHEHQPGVATATQDGEQPCEERQGAVVIEVASDASRPFDRRSDMWLTAEPGQ